MSIARDLPAQAGLAAGNQFYLLGAGFSRAIGREMPTLDELRDGVLESLQLELEQLRPFLFELEQWMSHLAADQPWVSDSQNLRNHARFVEASSAVCLVIADAEAQVLATPVEPWLARMVRHWSDKEAAVASFNYDPLVERAVTHRGRASSWSDLYGMSLEERMPAGSSRFLSHDPPEGTVPTLFKLHGSINWAYGLNAPVSDRVVMTLNGLGWAPLAPAPTGFEKRFRTVHDALSPLIVPPTGAKNHYYSNLSLRGQWRRAFAALQQAREVTIIGYSFPPGDFQTGTSSPKACVPKRSPS